MDLSERYDFKWIEEKWRGRWVESNIFRTSEDKSKPKCYVLEAYPYPSGDLHMGHVKNYTIGDVLTRYKVMNGFRVLHPVGWDSYGLPTENEAIRLNIHPAEWTKRCIENMKEQFNRLGVACDWGREIDTSDAEYTKWTQWLFLKFYERGLAYRAEFPVNWCPSCQTVLADEQVIDGLCERCDSAVTKRELANWFFKITDYADRLLADLELLAGWPERVKLMQEHWIGKSFGVEFSFKVKGREVEIPVFTTRIDTVFGVTYVVLAPEHPLVVELVKDTEREEEVLRFVEEARLASAMVRTAVGGEKAGIFIGVYAINPLNGEEVPIWVAPYVLMEYGTGAIMAVPAHDQRDFEFAKAQGLPVRVVIKPPDAELDEETMEEAYEEPGIQVNSGEFNGLNSEEAKERIANYMEGRGIGRRQVNYRLRDWCFSRQRYWGAPIPIVYCAGCGIVAVPEEELPVLLPVDVDFQPGWPAPLARSAEFVNTGCPKCGKLARRETDVMDTFVYSSWYFLRFISPWVKDSPFDSNGANYWLPVDQYTIGIEHATVHLIYARFFHKVLYDMGLVGFEEPFKNVFTQGMVTKDGAKMSKSKGNVVAPDEIMEKYGADALRVYILFMGPPELDSEWSDKGIEGAYRFLGRVWRLVNGWCDKLSEVSDVGELSDAERDLRRWRHRTVKRVAEDIGERFHFNTAIARLMEWVNELYRFEVPEESRERSLWVLKESLETLILLLSPFAPHLAEELWERLGKEGSVYHQDWPKWDEEELAEEEIRIPVQVNGKLRDVVVVSAEADEEELKGIILASEKVRRHIAGKEIERFVVVPKRLVNIVVR